MYLIGTYRSDTCSVIWCSHNERITGWDLLQNHVCVNHDSSGCGEHWTVGAAAIDEWWHEHRRNWTEYTAISHNVNWSSMGMHKCVLYVCDISLVSFYQKPSYSVHVFRCTQSTNRYHIIIAVKTYHIQFQILLSHVVFQCFLFALFTFKRTKQISDETCSVFCVSKFASAIDLINTCNEIAYIYIHGWLNCQLRRCRRHCDCLSSNSFNEQSAKCSSSLVDVWLLSARKRQI